MNVAHRPIDLKNDKSNIGNAGYSYEERGKFGRAAGHRLCGHLPPLLPGAGGGLLLVELHVPLPQNNTAAH